MFANWSAYVSRPGSMRHVDERRVSDAMILEKFKQRTGGDQTHRTLIHSNAFSLTLSYRMNVPCDRKSAQTGRDSDSLFPWALLYEVFDALSAPVFRRCRFLLLARVNVNQIWNGTSPCLHTEGNEGSAPAAGKDKPDSEQPSAMRINEDIRNG